MFRKNVVNILFRIMQMLCSRINYNLAIWEMHFEGNNLQNNMGLVANGSNEGYTLFVDSLFNNPLT